LSNPDGQLTEIQAFLRNSLQALAKRSLTLAKVSRKVSVIGGRSMSTEGSSRPRIVIKSEEKRIVFGEVYSPLHIDTDGEAMTAEDIEMAAYAFMEKGRTSKIDVGHNQKESGCHVVESFLARKNDPDGFIEGAWVLGVKIVPDALWEAVKKGELNGFSFMGSVEKVPVKAKVVVARKLIGETEESTGGPFPPHKHAIKVAFSSDGRLLSGETEEAVGHTHPIRRATATESSFDHSHRMILVKN